MMNPCDVEEEPSRTKKLKLSFSSPSGLSLLPEEMVLSCLARVSRTDHASLSLVSKWHRSVVASPELYDFRSLLGFTENRIYLCLRIPPDPNPRWFTLSPKALNRRLVPVQSYFYQPPEASSIVAHGCGIYIMGGRVGGRATSSVLFLDCRSHTWSTLPSMAVARYSAVAGVVDGKIYIFGGCDGWKASRKWGEVFDPEQQTWDALPLPPPKNNFPLVCESIVTEEEKVVVMNGLGICLFYIPRERKWKKGFREISGIKRCWHVIENVVYCSESGGRILWCEPSELERDVMEWREVMGLEALRKTLAASKLVNYGGRVWDQWEICRRLEPILALGLETMEVDDIYPGHKLSNSGPNMLIFWDVLAPHKLEIWCAEISLERRKKTCEIIGNIVWSEAVMTLDPLPHQHHLKGTTSSEGFIELSQSKVESKLEVSYLMASGTRPVQVEEKPPRSPETYHVETYGADSFLGMNINNSPNIPNNSQLDFFWNPFSSLDYYGYNYDNRSGMEEEVRRVREEEGIPDLEEEDESPRFQDHHNMKATDDYNNGCKTDQEGNVGEVGTQEQEQGNNVVTTDGAKGFTLYLTRRPTSMGEVIKDLEHQFEIIGSRLDNT